MIEEEEEGDKMDVDQQSVTEPLARTLQQELTRCKKAPPNATLSDLDVINPQASRHMKCDNVPWCEFLVGMEKPQAKAAWREALIGHSSNLKNAFARVSLAEVLRSVEEERTECELPVSSNQSVCAKLGQEAV
jgi:hypothetical protein